MKRSLIAALILIAVWAMVFFVPSLNFLFRAQWQGNTLMPFAVRPGLGWSNEIPDAELQRFERDKNVLLLAALQLPRAKEKVASNGDWQPQDREEFYPSALFPGHPEGTRHAELLRRLEQLVAKYPDDPTLIAATLRMGLVAGGGGRGTEELAPEYATGPGIRPLSSDALRRLIVLCERGQKLEPDNLFFDWMRCCFLLLSWQDEEALQALEKAAAKPRYETHVLQGLRYIVQAHSMLLGRALTPEEKRELLVLPDLAYSGSYWNMARMVAVPITKAQRRGEHYKALRLTEALTSTGAKMRKARQFSIHRYDMLEEVGYAAPIFDARMAAPIADNVARAKRNLALFRAYALLHGRSDLATKAQTYYQQIPISQKQVETHDESQFLGVSYWNWAATDLLWQFSVLLLLYLPVPLLLCLVLGTVLWRRGESEKEPVSPREVWQCTWACSLGFVFCYAMSVALAIMFDVFDHGALDLWTFESLYLFSANKHDLTDALWLPAIFAIILAAHHAVRRQTRGEPLKVSWFARLAQFAVVITIAIICWNVIFGEARVALCWLLALSFAVLFYYHRQWRKRPHRREAARYGLRLLYHSLATWLVVGSVLYLCTLVIALPLRHRAEAKIDQVLAVGERRAIEME